jgi:hypothetical protein
MKKETINFISATKEEAFAANQNGKIVKIQAVGLEGVSAQLKYPYSQEQFDAKLNLFHAMYGKGRALEFFIESEPIDEKVKTLF